MDPFTHYQSYISNIGPGEAGAIHVYQSAAEQETGCNKRFQERIFTHHHPGGYYLHVDRTGKSFNRTTGRSNQFIADVYWPREYETFTVGDWCSHDSGFAFNNGSLFST